jgi:hypothetical protein
MSMSMKLSFMLLLKNCNHNHEATATYPMVLHRARGELREKIWSTKGKLKAD